MFKIHNICPSINIHYLFCVIGYYEVLSDQNILHNVAFHALVLYVYLPCTVSLGQSEAKPCFVFVN